MCSDFVMLVGNVHRFILPTAHSWHLSIGGLVPLGSSRPLTACVLAIFIMAR